jgi:hypothetical protein
MAMVVAKNKGEEDYSIKPEAVTPAVDTSTWPLLLKNYNQRKFTILHQRAQEHKQQHRE